MVKNIKKKREEKNEKKKEKLLKNLSFQFRLRGIFFKRIIFHTPNPSNHVQSDSKDSHIIKCLEIIHLSLAHVQFSKMSVFIPSISTLYVSMTFLTSLYKSNRFLS